MKRRLALLVVAVLLAGCTEQSHGTGREYHGAFSEPYDNSVQGALPYERRHGSTQLGDPPETDLCRTIGVAFLARIGFVASARDGQAAAECDLAPNATALGVADEGQASLEIVVDENLSTVFDPGKAPDTNIDGYGLYVSEPDTNDPGCTDDLTTNLLDVNIHADSDLKDESASTLCAIAKAAATQVASVISGQVPLVHRTLSKDSLTNQDLCAAVNGTPFETTPLAEITDSWVLGFGSQCEFSEDAVNWWVDIEFGVDSLAEPTSTMDVNGHHFSLLDDTSDGWCRMSWQGPIIPGSFEHEQLVFTRATDDGSPDSKGCDKVASLAGPVVTTLGRH